MSPSIINDRRHEVSSCGCVGPQDGQPLCPCQMRGVKVENGRYIMPAKDLGPVRGDDRHIHEYRNSKTQWGRI